MKRSIISLVCIFLGLHIIVTSLRAIILPRSQSLDLPRAMVGWNNQIRQRDNDYFFGTFSLIAQYNHTMRSDAFARALFGESCLTSDCQRLSYINVTGSHLPGRTKRDWLADYFGLPTDFSTSISIEPEIDSFIIDMNAYLQFDCVASGLFLWLHAPIVHSRARINYTELNINVGMAGYDAGYFAPEAIDREALVSDFDVFLGFKKVPNLGFGTTFLPLEKAKWPIPSSKQLNDSGLSDLYAILGWNFLQQCDYHVGLGLVMVAPTGNHVQNEFIFQPLIGNGHCFELGGYFTSHYTFWRDCDDYRSLTISLDAIVNHMFSSKQCHTFDLKNRGCSSKYLLAEQMKSPAVNLFSNNTNTPSGPTITSVAPNAQFDGVYSPVANLTSMQVNVSHALQADIAAMLTYQTMNQQLSIDCGYDFWIRTKTKFSPCGSSALASGTWALKGDAYAYGFGASNAITNPNLPIALSATQNNATIHAGLNTPSGTTFVADNAKNPGIDNPTFALTSTIIANPTDRIVFAPGLPATDANQQRTSLQPILLTAEDIDFEKESVQSHSHKFFAHISYTWPNECSWSPYLGYGAFIELGQQRNGCANIKNNVLSQWGGWIKTGLSF